MSILDGHVYEALLVISTYEYVMLLMLLVLYYYKVLKKREEWFVRCSPPQLQFVR